MGRSCVIAWVVIAGCSSAGKDVPVDSQRIVLDAPIVPDAPGAVTMTQANSVGVMAGNSFNCNYGSPTFYTAENSYYRIFPLSDYAITNTFHLETVQFLVETAKAGTGTEQPATIRLHLYTGAIGAVSFSATDLTLITSTDIMIPNGAGTAVVAPIATDVAPGSNLAVEILVPDAMTAHHEFFIGSNTDGETRPGYIRAPASGCGMQNPTTLQSIATAKMLSSNSMIIIAAGRQ